MTLKESGVVSTAVFPGATGHGGNISVNVGEDISAIFSFTPSRIGNGGNIYVFTATFLQSA